MTDALPSPSQSDRSFSRALALWRGRSGGEAPIPEAEERSVELGEPDRSILSFAPYALALVLVLGVGATAASIATAPDLSDSIDSVTAIDARAMGLAADLDPSGQQRKAATLTKDVGALKSEITRLNRALDQSKSSQAALSKQAAGQAAAGQDEVRVLKGQIAELQKTLEATREQSAQRIEQLSAKVEQPTHDAAKVAELQQRLDRVERDAAEKAADKAPKTTVAAREPEPETTGSLAEKPRAPDAPIVRNWTVRDVERGVALLEGRHGMIEVVRGARAPGMGRIRSIERRDGQWVVVTDRGLVIERSEL